MSRQGFRSVTARLLRCCARLRREESGVAFIETIIILPVILVFLVGILEFSGLLLTKLQVETGLKEAARYIARCHTSGTCSDAIARNIAVYGHPGGGTSPRAFGWLSSGSIADVIQISVEERTATALGGQDFEVVRVSTNFNYGGSPLIGLIGFEGLAVQAFHEERVIGF